jgi:protein TonB
MTMSFPHHSFDIGAPSALPRDRNKAVAAGITIAIHLAVALGLLAAVKVAPAKLPHVLTVQVMMDKAKPAQDTLPPPTLAKPSTISVAMPEIQIQTTRPVMAQQAVRDAVAPPPVAAAQRAMGESRESFLNRLLAQLNRYKRYPREARTAHIEGVTLLHFVMDAQGRVLSFDIAKSSGRPMLDAEALALIQRAQPLPALPDDYPTRTLDAVVPIVFALNA